jgi:preprotein translocase subunit SecG
MLNIVISFLTFVLIINSLFLVLVILMQRANSNAGMGSAFGGGVTESAFGAETTNILTRATKWSSIAFFVIALVLYLLYMSREGRLAQPESADLPDIPVVTETVPADQPLTVTEDQVVAEAETAVDEASQAVSGQAEDLAGEAAELPPVEETTTPPAP